MKRICRAFFMALGTFTAIPCPCAWNEDDRPLMLACLPIVGALIGAAWLALALLALRWLPAAGAALTCAVPWLLTGFIHLDGYMDTSDALLCWRPLDERLRILKDAHAGAFAVIAMALLALFSYDAASKLRSGDDLRALVFIPVVSRCCSAFCVAALKPIGHSQYAQFQPGAAVRTAVAAMWLIAVALCTAWLGAHARVLAIETLAYALATLWARRALKGVSGDTAGFALSIAECAALVALAGQIHHA